MKQNKFAPLLALAVFLAASPVFFGTAIGASYYSIANGSNATINEWSNCRKVTNSTGKQIFVPTNTSTEWSEFLSHYPSGISLSACFSGKIIFTTSTTYTGTSLTNDSTADSNCATRASAASLPGTFKALIYLGSRMPADVLPSGTSFVNPLNTLIANDKNDFFTDDGGGSYIRSTLQYNEYGNANSGGAYVWTAFKPTGGGAYSVVPNGTDQCWGYKIKTCYRYLNNSNKTCGTYGYYYVYDNWSYAGVNNLTSAEWAGRKINFQTSTCQDSCSWVPMTTLDGCLNNSYSLYCVQQ